MNDGRIAVDSNYAKELGFTSDKFTRDSYLWKSGDRIMISLIVSRHPGQGHLSELFAAIEARGLRVAVPTPSADMRRILKQKGFVPHMEEGSFGFVEVWEKAAGKLERK
jgi:hypothetical protein